MKKHIHTIIHTMQYARTSHLFVVIFYMMSVSNDCVQRLNSSYNHDQIRKILRKATLITVLKL